MFEEPIHPDTTQSSKMSKNSEDFLLLEEGELDYEELDDAESPSTTCSGSTDTKRPSTTCSGSTDSKRSSTAGSGDDSRVQDSAKPIQRKGCIVSSL
ncbi:hypothetical protein CEXT_1301 [Caerostris extrusa]|uniref:Uncharacterized protein n=1 Tax=Caerostris extrusa TaxID=172846 RepID=A0AAV4SJQ5_CAEEX|nr:hypothetical protein CEXT_1301 [Caerostris extrusa]